MAVFVDDMQTNAPNERWPYPSHCHLVADTIEELHTFAQCELHLKRSWYQHTTVPHYDLTASKRKKAVARGAVELSRPGMGDFIAKHRIRK
jgi:hypothetical protein